MFNKNKKRNYRSKKPVQEEDNEDEAAGNGSEEEEVASSLQERRELQSFRKRQTGVSAEALLAGEKVQLKKEVITSTCHLQWFIRDVCFLSVFQRIIFYKNFVFSKFLDKNHSLRVK